MPTHGEGPVRDTTPVRVAISGAAGRTGARLLAACASTEGFLPAAALEAPGSPHLGRDAGEVAGIAALGLPLSDSPTSEFDVLIDFSTPGGTRARLADCLERERPMVIGTTGLLEEDLATLERATRRIAIVRSPNMALGVNLLRRVTAELARSLRRLDLAAQVEIVDVHHRHKQDAPSGTALALARDVDPVCGGDEGAPAIHSLRLGGRAGDHAVHFGLGDETLTLSHSAHSRDPFLSGALHAARWVVGRSPGSYDMQSVLFADAEPGAPTHAGEEGP